MVEISWLLANASVTRLDKEMDRDCPRPEWRSVCFVDLTLTLEFPTWIVEQKREVHYCAAMEPRIGCLLVVTVEGEEEEDEGEEEADREGLAT